MTAGGAGGLVGVDDPALFDLGLELRRWGRRSEPYLYGSRKGTQDRFGYLADGTPYDMIFTFDSIGYNFEPTEISAAYGLVQLDKLAGVQPAAARQLASLGRLPGDPRGRHQGSDNTRDRHDLDALLLHHRRRPRYQPQRSPGAARSPRRVDTDGLDRQHPASEGIRGDRAPGARRRAAELRLHHGQRHVVADPPWSQRRPHGFPLRNNSTRCSTSDARRRICSDRRVFVEAD